MRRLALILDLLIPFMPFLLTLIGGLGTIYVYGTGGGRFLLAVFLVLLLAGVSLFVMEETKRDEFLAKFLSEKTKKPTKKRQRKMGKRCPKCNRMIHHRRTVCQHCGHEFPSKQYKEEKAKRRSEKRDKKVEA